MFSRLCSIVTNTSPVFNKGTTSTPSIVPKLLIPGDHLSIIKIGKVDKNKQFYVSYLHNGKIDTWVVQIHSNCYLRMLENENFEEILKVVSCDTNEPEPIWTKVPNCEFDGFVISDMNCYHKIVEPISYEWRLKSGDCDWGFDYIQIEPAPKVEKRTILKPIIVIDNYFPTK